MELVFLLGNLLSLALLAAIAWLGYRTLWKALVVVTPAGEQVVDLFADDDPSREFWLVSVDGAGDKKGQRVGTGLTIGSGAGCDLRADGPEVDEQHLKILPYRDWCGIESLSSAGGYTVNGQSMQGHSLLKEDQCLTIGELSIRLVRRPI